MSQTAKRPPGSPLESLERTADFFEPADITAKLHGFGAVRLCRGTAVIPGAASSESGLTQLLRDVANRLAGC